MNCKPGQLVRYVGTNPLNRPNIYGWIGKVIETSPFTEPGWRVDPPLPGGDIRVAGVAGVARFKAEFVRDSSLRPIDNPGDDAVDEVIQRIGTPNKEIA